jgi:hypothetical protein
MTIWTDTLGAEIRFRQAGAWRTRSIEAGDGPAVIMMGGLTGHAEAFSRNVLPLAARGLRVHAIDCLGHGLTDRPIDVVYHAPVFTTLTAMDRLCWGCCEWCGERGVWCGWLRDEGALHRIGRRPARELGNSIIRDSGRSPLRSPNRRHRTIGAPVDSG